MNKVICDCCKKIIDIENSRRIRMVVHEKVKDRIKNGKYVGHTKLDVCTDCLKKLGYKFDALENRTELKECKHKRIESCFVGQQCGERCLDCKKEWTTTWQGD